MALEALTNAISQAGRDYMAYKREDERIALEDKRHARDREEKLADEQRALENQKAWFNYTNQQGMEYEMQKIRAMSAEQKRQLALELGINPNQPEAQLGEAIFQAQLERSRRTKLAETGAQDEANAAKKEAVGLALDNAYRELDEARKSAGIGEPDLNKALEPQAIRMLSQVIPENDAQKKAFWAKQAQLTGNAALATPEGQRQFMAQPPALLAQQILRDDGRPLISKDDVDSAKVGLRMASMQALKENGYDINGLHQRISNLESEAVKLGVIPSSRVPAVSPGETPFKKIDTNWNFFSGQQAPADAGNPLAGSPVVPTPPATLEEQLRQKAASDKQQRDLANAFFEANMAAGNVADSTKEANTALGGGTFFTPDFDKLNTRLSTAKQRAEAAEANYRKLGGTKPIAPDSAVNYWNFAPL